MYGENERQEEARGRHIYYYHGSVLYDEQSSYNGDLKHMKIWLISINRARLNPGNNEA